MALAAYLSLWISLTNAFIALFIMVYAYLFLKKTNRHRDRRPWDFLFLASFLYLIYQIFSVVVLTGVSVISLVDMQLVSSAMSFLYSSAVLLAFISQHDLILQSQLILISKKDRKKEAEQDLEISIGERKR